MIIIGLNTSNATLTPIALSDTAEGYQLAMADSQPIIPPNTGGSGVEINGVAVAQIPNQNIQFDGVLTVTGGGNGYAVTVTAEGPNSGATFASLTATGLPAGVTASVALNTAPAASTVTFLVTADAVPGTYSYTLTAVIENRAGVNGGLTPAVPLTVTPIFAGVGSANPSEPWGLVAFPYVYGTGGIEAVALIYYESYTGDTDGGVTLTVAASDPGITATMAPGTLGTGQPPPGISYVTNLQCSVLVNDSVASGTYSVTFNGTKNGLTQTLVMPLIVQAAIPNPGTVTLNPQITVGPAWPPPQVLTPGAGVNLTTDAYAYSITAGDSVDIMIYETGFSAWTGYGPLIASEQAPEIINGKTQDFGTLWFSFPANATSNTYTPNGSTPVKIDTAKLTTTLLTPPGLYAFTIYDHNYTPNPGATIYVQVLSPGSQAATSTGTSLSGTLALPASAPAGSRSGVIAHPWRGIQVLRAKTMPVNPRSPAQSRARAGHINRVAAIQANTVTQADAWAAAANQFPGQNLKPAGVFDGVNAETNYLKMTPAQFQYMCQSTQQSFGQPVTLTPTVGIGTWSLGPGQTSPWFPQGESLSTAVAYDLSYQVTGFALGYTFLPTGEYFGGYGTQAPAPSSWIIAATSASAGSVASKSGSGFTVLGYFTYPVTPSEILSAWEAVYGDLPASGTIYFSIRPADPYSGVTGMAVIEGLSYKAGSILGSTNMSGTGTPASAPEAWFGPYLGIFSSPTGGSAAAGSSFEMTMYLKGEPDPNTPRYAYGGPYAGTITFDAELASVKSASATQGVTQTAMPNPPITFTFTPDTITIPSGSTTPVPVTFTCNLPAGTPTGTWLFKLKATDAHQTVEKKVLVACGPTITAYNGMMLTPGVSLLTIAPGSNQTVTYTVTNYGTQAQMCQVVLGGIAAFGWGSLGGVTVNPSGYAAGSYINVPGASGSTPGTASFTATLAVPSTVSQTQTEYSITVDGVNQDLVAIGLITVNTTQGIAISPQYQALTLPIGGHQTVTYTVSNYYATPQTLTIFGTQTGPLTTVQSIDSVTVPAASGGTPGTATFTITGTWTGTGEAGLEGLRGNVGNSITSVNFILDGYLAG